MDAIAGAACGVVAKADNARIARSCRTIQGGVTTSNGGAGRGAVRTEVAHHAGARATVIGESQGGSKGSGRTYHLTRGRRTLWTVITGAALARTSGIFQPLHRTEGSSGARNVASSIGTIVPFPASGRNNGTGITILQNKHPELYKFDEQTKH
jgi:hypothetical protein